ncbi:MAG: hypothetical protein ACXWC4_00085 [Telluria sp.]
MDKINDSILDSPMGALRQEMARMNAPRYVEKELMQAFAAQFPRKARWWDRFATPGWSLGGSFASVLLVVLAFGMSGGPRVTGGASDAQPLVSRDGDGVFIALDSAERIEAEPAPRMIETQVPRSTLASFGVSVTPENAGDQVKAEMLVGADGSPLALRLTSLD